MGIFTKGATDRAKKTAAKNAAKKAAEKAVKPISTYHASPHLFDKFDTSKIGTGEGAQSYGHGMYLAESPEVSGRGGAYDEVFTRRMNYRDQMADLTDRMNRATIGGKPLAKTYNIESDPDLLSAIKKRDVEEVLRRAREQMDRWHELSTDPQYPYRNYAEERLKGYEKLSNDLHGGAELYYPSRANIYEVDIHTDPDRLLNWDAPIENQSKYVKGVLSELGFKRDLDASREFDDALAAALTGEGSSDLPKRPTKLGRDVYQWKQGEGLGGSLNAPQASQRLLDAGVPGIRYLDQGSRSTGSGTSNYVVFDPNLLEIKRRYAKGGATVKAHGGRVSPLAVKRK